MPKSDSASSKNNIAPIAVNQQATGNISAGTKVELDGSRSSDANGDPLTYRWALTQKPSESTAEITQASSPISSFVTDVAGDYEATLIVNDGMLDSASTAVALTAEAEEIKVVSVEPEKIELVQPPVKKSPVPMPAKANTKVNTAPIAKAGSRQTVSTYTPVSLNGNASSDADNDSLTFRWALTTKPTKSIAQLENPEAATPVFTPDLTGIYIVSLIVNDGSKDSQVSKVVIESADPDFAFSNNIQESVITTYVVNKESGVLTKIAATPTAAHPISMVVHPSQKYLYVTHVDENSVAIYSIHRFTGALTKISSVPVVTPDYPATVKPAFITGDVKGRFVYVASRITNNTTGSFTTKVTTFSINPSTGTLTAGAIVSPPLNNWSLDVHPNGSVAYIPSYNKNNITSYTVDPDSGALTEISAT
ncbi:MAG: beta-propeller fold lactonase family protein, partial [Porticoccus sp.]|nr:beta-propeller fold lactonase family protein [Porticoccus sp.]